MELPVENPAIVMFDAFRGHSGSEIEEVKVNLRLSVMKELEAKWLVSTYDYFKGNSSIIQNGFKEVGIIDAVEGQQLSEPDEDPLADIDWFCDYHQVLMIDTVIYHLSFFNLMINTIFYHVRPFESLHFTFADFVICHVLFYDWAL